MLRDALACLRDADAAGARALLSKRGGLGVDELLLAGHLGALLAFSAGEPEEGRRQLEAVATRERERGLLAIARHSEHALALLLNDDSSLGETKSYYRETWENVRRYSGPEAQGLIAKSLAELCLAAGRLPEAGRLLRRAAELMVADEPCAAQLSAWASLVDSV